MQFTKPPRTNAELVTRLQQRGMTVTDPARAEYYLNHINYYRLGAYWLAFEVDHDNHRFHPGTTFDEVLNRYTFDRELRLLIMDAVERVEVSIRTQLAYHLSHRHGAHVHLQPEIFKNQRFYQRSKAKLVELMTLGQLSKWYGNIKRRADRKVIADVYDLDEKYLSSFLHHLSGVRNICAHHSRLWNREFTVTSKLPSTRSRALVGSLNTDAGRRIYNTLVILAYLMDQISGQHHWKQRLFDLIANHSRDYKLPLHAMGFPEDYQERTIWQLHS